MRNNKCRIMIWNCNYFRIKTFYEPIFDFESFKHTKISFKWTHSKILPEFWEKDIHVYNWSYKLVIVPWVLVIILAILMSGIIRSTIIQRNFIVFTILDADRLLYSLQFLDVFVFLVGFGSFQVDDMIFWH